MIWAWREKLNERLSAAVTLALLICCIVILLAIGVGYAIATRENPFSLLWGERRRNDMGRSRVAFVLLFIILVALSSCATAAKGKAVATLPATGYSQEINPSLFGFIFGGAYRERVCMGSGCAERIVATPSKSYYGGMYSTGSSYDAWAGRGQLPVNPPSYPTSSDWLDPQGPEYRAWACNQYGSFNGAPCR